MQKRKIQEQYTIVDGDAKYIPIAAASIVAKEARDSYIENIVKKYPDLETKYNLGSCKGYGTEKHRKGILAHGKHQDHRELFLRKLLDTTSDCLITDT